MDDRRLATILRRQRGVVSTVQLRSCGLSSAGISARRAGSRLFHVLRGVYSTSPHLDERAWLWAAVLAIDGERAVVSHWTAAWAHQMRERRPGLLHVTVPGGGRPGVAGVVVHRSRSLRPTDVVLVDGIRVTSPARTVLDLGAHESDAELLRTIREGEFRGALGVGAVRDAVVGRHGHPGVSRVRRVDPATAEAGLRQTPLEDELAPVLEDLGVPGLERQQWVTGSSGQRYRADFTYSDVRLAVEGDGRAAHERAAAFEADRARDADLGAVGWQTLRFTRIQVLQAPRRVADLVRRTHEARSMEARRDDRRAA